MLADIRAGKIDAVVVWDLDRLHRQPIELEHLMKLADEKHLALATVTSECDLSTHNGRLFARIKGAVARAEMDQKSVRQKRAARQSAENGTAWWSTRPFGYDADRDANGGWWTYDRKTRTHNPIRLHPVEAEAVRQAYSAVLAGASCYGVVADWNRRGLLTPRSNRWRGSQVRQLLLSPRNAGLRTYKGDKDARTPEDRVGAIDASWPAIVERDVWRGVVDKLADPERRYGPSRARRHLLSNLAVCGGAAGAWAAASTSPAV